jgi:glutamine synthetase
MIATLCKPFSNRTGSGAHFHISLGSDKTKNLFEDKTDKAPLASTLAYQFLGGVLAHARALAAVCAPTVNSYKRLVVGRALSGATWAPAYVAYGDNNRTACVRIPGGRLEFRLPDSGCNPYLALAALVAAGIVASIAS